MPALITTAIMAAASYAGKMHKEKRERRSVEELTLAFAEMKRGIRKYRQEYGKYPVSYRFDVHEADESLIRVLAGSNHTGINPLEIRFIRPPTSNKEPVALSSPAWNVFLGDPWGVYFSVSVDANGDGKVADPEHPGAFIADDVILWSRGPDRKLETWKDNIRSWDPVKDAFRDPKSAATH